MMRSLWTGAAGMKAQQTSVDTIANNLANVNTTGYKAQSTEFKSLLYQTLQTETTTSNGDPKPTTAQVGLGTRVASLNSNFTQGAQLKSDNPMALCINGKGFYAVRGADNEVYYTRAGDFGWALDTVQGERVLADPNGNKLLDTNLNPVVLPEGVGADSVTVSADGTVAYRNENGVYVETGQQIALFQFPNNKGLEKVSDSLLQETAASGAAINEVTTNLPIERSTIAQGYLEGSNVDVATEMVNLIISQRAYELNSRAITVSDTMLEQANNLKR